MTSICQRLAYSYRDDPDVPDFADDRPVIVFDGYCVFCSRWARFVLKHDRKALFRLLPAQSALGEALYRHYGLSTENYETNILLMDGQAVLKSRGVLTMFRLLGFPWSLAGVFGIVPWVWLDPLYELVARNRFLLAGRRDSCYVPEPGMRDRFLG